MLADRSAISIANSETGHYHVWTRLALVSLRRDRPKVPAAALPGPFSATRGRRLLGVFGLPLGRGLGAGKARCPLRAAKPDGVGRLPAVPAVVQPTPDRLRPDGPHLTRIQQAQPDGEAAGPFDAGDQGAQLRLGVRGGAPAGGRNGRFGFIPQARLEREGALELSRRASAASPGGTAEPVSTPPSARNMRRSPSVIIPSYRLDPDGPGQLVQQWVASYRSRLPPVILHQSQWAMNPSGGGQVLAGVPGLVLQPHLA